MSNERTKHRIEADFLDALEKYVRWSLNVKVQENPGQEFLKAFEEFVLSLALVDDEGKAIDAGRLRKMALWDGMKKVISSRGPVPPP